MSNHILGKDPLMLTRLFVPLRSALHLLSLGLCSLFVLALVACDFSSPDDRDEPEPTPEPEPTVTVTPEPEPEEDEAFLRVLHLSPEAPPVDAYVNGQGPAVSGLAFGNSTDNAVLAPGEVDLQVTAQGASPSNALLTINDVRLDEGRRYTAIAFGSLNALAGNVIEDSTQGLASNQVRVRVVHTAVGVGVVDIYADGTPITENLFYGSAAAPVDVPAQAFVAGIDVDNNGQPDLLYDIPALTPGTSVNVFAVADASGVYLIAQLPGATTVRIDAVSQELRVLHLSPDAPAVIPVLGGNNPLGQIPFGQSTDYVTVGSASANLAVTTDGTLGTSVLTADLPLERGKRYTAVAYGNLANIGATYFVDDPAGLAAGNIRVRAIHGAPSVGQVDIYAVDADGTQSLLLADVNFGDVANPLDVPAGAYTLGVDVNNDAQSDVMFALPDISAGTLANVYVTEDASGNVFALAQLPGSFTARIDPATAEVRVVHLSRDAPNVDVYVDGAAAISNLPFKQQSGKAELFARTIQVDVTPAGAGLGSAVLSGPVTLLPNQSYTVVAYDDVAQIKAVVLLDEDQGLSTGSIRLPVSHVAPLVTRGDLFELVNGNAFGTQLVDDFGFGETQTPPDLPAAAYTVGFDANAIGVVAVSFDLPLITPGTFARAFVFNELDGSVAVLVTLPNTTIVVPAN